MENVNNKVMLTGNAGAAVEIKEISKNLKVGRVNLAVNEYFKNAAGEEVKKTQWFSLTFWNAKAELAAEQVKKGTKLTVEGRLQNNSYEAKDGTKRFSTEIIVNEFIVKSTVEVS